MTHIVLLVRSGLDVMTLRSDSCIRHKNVITVKHENITF